MSLPSPHALFIRCQKRGGLLVICLLPLFVSYSWAQIAVRGETVYTMAGKPIADGVVLIRGNRIEKVGSAAAVAIPAGYKVLSGKVVTPGFIDAHSVVGLSGIFNTPADQMQLDRSEPIQPELRAIDAYNPREPLVEYLRGFGVTTLHTGHAPGALASGTTIVVKTVGGTVNEALVDGRGMVAFTLGESVMDNFKTPGTSAKAVAMIRSELLKAQDYVKRKSAKDPDKRPAPDLRMEMLAGVLRGEIRVLFTAQTATSIMTALRLQKEFGFKMVLDGAAEAPLVIEEITKAGVPVILHPTMGRASGDMKNLSMETAALLKRAGIPFALQSGYESYVPKTRVVLFEAAIAASNGLTRDEALAAITIDAARIIGLESRLGSLEAGKDADLVVFDGDPLEYTSHACAVLVNGVVTNEICK
jgi:imidazolonepropionase-like amidohydrolase